MNCWQQYFKNVVATVVLYLYDYGKTIGSERVLEFIHYLRLVHVYTFPLVFYIVSSVDMNHNKLLQQIKLSKQTGYILSTRYDD